MSAEESLNTNLEDLYFEYYTLCEFSSHYSILQFGSLIKKFKEGSNVEIEKFINTFDSCCEGTNFDITKFKEILKLEFDELKKQKEFNPTQLEIIFRKSNKKLKDYIKSIELKIEKVPNSITKAKCLLRGRIKANGPFDCDEIYRAIAFLREELSPNVPDRIYNIWKKQYESHKKEEKYERTERHIFWGSSSTEHFQDLISRYKMYELYEFNEFHKVFKEVEQQIEQELLSLLSDQNAEIADFIVDISESKKLFNKYRSLINFALENIYSCQKEEGFWIRYFDEKTPDFDLSAYSTLCLTKFTQNIKYQQAGIKGAKWLLTNQNTNGSWNSTISQKPSEIITLTALESIVRSKIPAKRSIESGIDWLLSQQVPFGGWGNILLDVLIIDFLENIKSLTIELTPYLKISKSYLSKSLELAQEDDIDYHRIAVTTAYHGLEFFLYGLLSETNINIKVYDHRNNQTIGFRSALNKLQEYLQKNKKIKADERLYNANDLDVLAYIRDEIVHKAAAVERANVLHLIRQATDFMTKYSKEILGYDIWY